ncbi:uncharacterized protein LOC142575012 [Dermacentor variabilis]|uniref:uncharacterized protein LOC142575012 n=1 Tax=Dermacentor variabilis TaxID=34621 RepID=UPI003F5C4174
MERVKAKLTEDAHVGYLVTVEGGINEVLKTIATGVVQRLAKRVDDLRELSLQVQIVVRSVPEVPLIVKLCSSDKTIKKLAGVSTLDAVKRKAVEFRMCRNQDMKVYLLDGTEVDEEAFSCLAESVESGTHTFTVCNGEWICDDEVRSSRSRDLAPSFVSKVALFWKNLSQDVLEALDKGAYLRPPEKQEVASKEMTGNFLHNLPVCPVIVALVQSIFQCTCHLFVDRELIIPNINLKLAIEYLFAVH